MTTEISTHRASTGLALQTFDDAWRFWQMVAKTEFAPKDFRGKPEACMLAGQHAAEIGIGPMQGLQCIAVINGRPSIWGDAALALVQSSPVCEWVTEQVEGDGDAMVAICTAQRRGYPQPTVVKFSVADAKKAGLWGKSGPWTQYPKRMLQLRARGFALRDAFPDVLKGLVTAEEAQDYPTPEPAREPVVVRPKFPQTESRPAAVERGHAPATAVDSHAQQTAQPPATPANEERMQQSRLAVNRAKSVSELERFRSTTEERLKSGAYTPAQADELFNLISHKLDWLTSEDGGQEFTHEAAEHEVQG
jgi:hypothetical protein